jgi:hypothetical protein
MIEVLYFHGCPNHVQLLEQLPHLLAREGVAAEIVLREVSNDEHARRERFLGSPTVRVDGRDIEPGDAHRRDYGRKCRIYQTTEGLSGIPPGQWILDALRDG